MKAYLIALLELYSPGRGDGHARVPKRVVPGFA